MERVAAGTPRVVRKLSLKCSSCGYGIVRAEPPDRCPMCQRETTWTHAPWRPYTLGPD
jgi:rubrerythrin